jgi:hypothetical protein
VLFEVMVAKARNRQSRDVSGERGEQKAVAKTRRNQKKATAETSASVSVPHTQVEGENTMRKLFTSTLLTVAAVPFLMAAPHAAKKAQNQATPATTQNTASTAKPKVKKHVKKVKKSANGSSTAASSTSAPVSK